MTHEERERRRQNIILAHAKVQGELLMLMMAVSGGYEDVDGGEYGEQRRRLARDAQDVIDAALLLKRTVVSGGDLRPPGVDGP